MAQFGCSWIVQVAQTSKGAKIRMHNAHQSLQSLNRSSYLWAPTHRKLQAWGLVSSDWECCRERHTNLSFPSQQTAVNRRSRQDDDRLETSICQCISNCILPFGSSSAPAFIAALVWKQDMWSLLFCQQERASSLLLHGLEDDCWNDHSYACSA